MSDPAQPVEEGARGHGRSMARSDRDLTAPPDALRRQRARSSETVLRLPSGFAADEHDVAQPPLVQRNQLDVVTGGLDDLVAADVNGRVVHARPVRLGVPQNTRSPAARFVRATGLPAVWY